MIAHAPVEQLVSYDHPDHRPVLPSPFRTVGYASCNQNEIDRLCCQESGDSRSGVPASQINVVQNHEAISPPSA